MQKDETDLMYKGEMRVEGITNFDNGSSEEQLITKK